MELFVHVGLMQVSPEAIIFLGGFWKFRWLNVRGLAGHAACSISRG